MIPEVTVCLFVCFGIRTVHRSFFLNLETQERHVFSLNILTDMKQICLIFVLKLYLLRGHNLVITVTKTGRVWPVRIVSIVICKPSPLNMLQMLCVCFQSMASSGNTECICGLLLS